ncbi:hypothetical protein EW146_g2742 [Bondarzewia mesenterica]|uniref:AB hydrolase-1 domain-containing protein n=1 Tax=Bondarzewia mesenterica TaxID=1095465 RepID=A0A4S4M197_9AGAM|nr:hypothetical protein EW146_g2742 [Bondarzewia mesenterica]
MNACLQASLLVFLSPYGHISASSCTFSKEKSFTWASKNGYAPLGARTEKLNRDIRVPARLTCEEIEISSEKVTLSGIIVGSGDAKPTTVPEPRTVIVYFQGNAGNPLHRLPVFSSLLSRLPSSIVIAVAPRSYWTSTSARPTQDSLIMDYTHVLSYASSRFPDCALIVYGHSLGSAIAICLLAQLPSNKFIQVRGLILENAFASVPAMVQALYPQKWLPYHYMGPLVWDKWDALQAVKRPPEGSLLKRLLSDTMVMVSEKDEVVPVQMGHDIFSESRASVKDSEVDLRRFIVVEGALHENAWTKRQWALAMKSYVHAVSDKDFSRSSER